MRDGPDIARLAALFGDPARAAMLLALMDGRSLTASELAAEGGVTRQTASTHLSRLLDGNLVAAERHGRHRYFRLAGADVAQTIESMIGLADRRGGARTRTGPRDKALRKARVCYDHLAGDMGVYMLDRMIAQNWLSEQGGSLAVTHSGQRALERLGIDIAALESLRRPLCRRCLDWSERRHHLAGALGAGLLETFDARRWLRRTQGTRALVWSAAGESSFRRWLG